MLCVVNDLDDGFLVSLNHDDIISQDTAERFVNVFKEILVQLLDKETNRKNQRSESAFFVRDLSEPILKKRQISNSILVEKMFERLQNTHWIT